MSTLRANLQKTESFVFEDCRELAEVIKEVFSQIQEDTEFCNFDITWLEVVAIEDNAEKNLLREEVVLL